MVDAERLLDSGLAHVITIVLGVVGAVALATGAATTDAFVFWIFYGIVWLTFLEQFEEKSEFWEKLFGGSTSDESLEADEETVPDEDPVTVLKRRYAEGAVDDEEFEARLDRLLETPDTLAELERERTR
jgi:hypothetical protein